MSKRQLFLKLIDLLLFSLLLKSQAGIDKLEEKRGTYVTSPQEYFWIFILNHKLGISLSLKKQNTLVRANFWIWQMAWATKRYYKEQPNRYIRYRWQNVITKPIRWFRTKLETGDSSGWQNLKIYHYLNQFNKVIQNSDLSPHEKKLVISFRDQIGKEMYSATRIFMRQDFDRLSLNQLLSWYKITYQKLSEFFGSFYLILNGISQTDPRWKNTIDFMKQMVIIAASHDDVSDIKSDIGTNGRLQEPNLFALFLKKEDRIAIGKQFSGQYIFTSMDDIKKSYPYAYRSFMKFIRENLRKIDLIPGINLHPLLEFYFFYFPDYFMIPISPDSKTKSNIRVDSLQSVASLEKNVHIIARFREQVEQEKKINKKVFSRCYQDLVSYLYAQQMANSGLPLAQISSYINKPISTISHWLNENRLPISLRTKRIKELFNSNKLFFLLGVFAFSGSINKNAIKIESKNKNLLIKLNNIVCTDKKLVFKTKGGYYFRYYNQPLASKLTPLKVDLISTLTKSSLFEHKQFVQGLFDSQENKQILRLNKKIGKEFIDWLSSYFQRNSQTVKINIKGNYYLLSIHDGKNRLVKPQQKNLWHMLIQGDQTAKNNLIEQYQKYGKKIIHQYFGQQKSEFWSELPSLMYICISQALDKYKEKYTNDKLLSPFLKYQILDYFRDYFKTNSSVSPTTSIDEVFEEKKSIDEIVEINWENEKVHQALKKLEKKDRRLYLVLVLRFGLYDGKEHSLTDDLSKRLYELGVTEPKNKILTKSQTYQLFQKGLNALKQNF